MGEFKVVEQARTYKTQVLVTFGNLAEFVHWANGRTAVREIVSGLGDAAFLGPKGAGEPNMLVFRKGSRAVRLGTNMLDEDGERAVSNAQLREIADLIASRMEQSGRGP